MTDKKTKKYQSTITQKLSHATVKVYNIRRQIKEH